MLREALVVVDSHLGEPALPDFSQLPRLLFQPKGESTLNELHGFLNGHVAAYRDQQVHVIWHDYKVMNAEFSRGGVRTQHIDHQCSVALRLDQRATLTRLRSCEEGARCTHNVFWSGMASG